MKKLTVLVLILFTLPLGCKRDFTPPMPSQKVLSAIERDPVFLQWGQSVNGRWAPYSFLKLDRSGVNKDNFMYIIGSAAKPINAARAYYRELLLAKYGSDIGNFNALLDTLYKKNYTSINNSLEKLSVMDALYLQYQKLMPTVNTTKTTTDLPVQDYTECKIPQDMYDFIHFNIVWPMTVFTPNPGLPMEVQNCQNYNMRQFGNWIAMLNDPSIAEMGNCGLYVSLAYQSMHDFYECDPLGTPPSGDSPADPFPPIGGGGGTGSGDTTTSTDPCDGKKTGAATDANNIVNNTSIPNLSSTIEATRAIGNLSGTNPDGTPKAREATFNIDSDPLLGYSATQPTVSLDQTGTTAGVASPDANTVYTAHGHTLDYASQPSAQDIWAAGEVNQSHPYVVGDLTFGNDGDYLIAVVDGDLFKKFDIKYPKGSNVISTGNNIGDFNSVSDLGKDLNKIEQNAYETYRINNGLTSAINDLQQRQAGNYALEAKLAYFVSKYDTGLVLLKKDQTTGNYQPLHYEQTTDANNNQKTTVSPCN